MKYFFTKKDILLCSAVIFVGIVSAKAQTASADLFKLLVFGKMVLLAQNLNPELSSPKFLVSPGPVVVV